MIMTENILPRNRAQWFKRFLSIIENKTIVIGLIYVLSAGNSFSQPGILTDLRRQLELHTANDTAKVNILNELSYQYQWIDFNLSMDYASQALKTAEQLSFNKGVAMASVRMAHCYWALGNGELSIEKALIAETIAEQGKFPDILGESFRILATNYRDQQEPEKAETYIKQAEKLSLRTKNWDLLSRVYNTLATIAQNKNPSDTSFLLSTYRKSLQIAEDHHTSRFHICQALSNMASVLGQSNADLEIAYLTKALQMARETSNRAAEAGIMADLGGAFGSKKRYTEATAYLLESLKLSRELGLKRITTYAYRVLAWLKTREGKSLEAFGYMENYYASRDSLLRTRQIVELEARHEAEKKEQAIKLLEQEKKIQTLWKNVLIVGSLFLLITVIVIYRLQQLRSRKSRELLDAQKQLNVKLKETDQLRSRFFANVSHEFRTPLSLILAPIEEKLKSPRLAGQDKDDLRLVNRNALRLLDLVNQLLDMSKLEAGKMTLRVREGNLDEFIKVVVASFDSLAESRRISFLKNIKVDKEHAWYDADKLEKIINNVLSNSFKFTEEGGSITLSTFLSPDSHSVTLQITDTGKGIPEEDLSHIFSPFYQSKISTADGQQGTGLGLSLVNELVKLYQGKIDLTSKINQGTSISITLPVVLEKFPAATEVLTGLSLPEAPQREDMVYVNENTESNEDIESEELYPDSILIVEDNPDLRKFMVDSFQNQFTTFHAKNGEEGVALAIEKIPTLIISDVMMPLMDGMGLTQKLKADERTSHIPIILLTAKSDTESRIAGLKTGADDYLAKPFSPEELKVRVINLIQQRKKLAEKFSEKLTMLAEPLREPTIDDKFILKARAIVEDNMSDTGFGVEKLADEMHLSRTQLFRKLKALASVSPSEFINNIRLQKAAHLIRARADTLTQISYSVGFNEQSYFAKKFRRKFGVSPSEYARTSP